MRRPSKKAVLGLESLEHRVVPATVAVIREATGAAAAAIQATVDTFRNDLGTNNGGGAPQTSGRREINWDGVPDNLATPTAALPGNQFVGRGALLATSVPFGELLVSQDDDNPADADPDQVRFSNLNPNYATALAAFSAQRLFSSGGSNAVDVTFTVPGSTTPAVTRGFGAVFTDVDTSGSTKIDFFDDHGTLVFSRQVLATAGNGTFSFLGVAFAGNCISRVRITAGSATTTTGLDDVTQAGSVDIVAMDDFLYAEPQLPALHPLAVSGQTNASAVSFTPDRGTFQYPAAPTATFSPFGIGTTNVRTAVGDLNGDCIPDTILVTGPGTPIRVAAISGANNTTVLVAPFDPFGGNFTGGGFVAVGDLTGDGNVEFVVTPDQGGGPRVTIFSRNADGTTATRANFLGIDDPNFRGGCRAALGDVNNDGALDLAAAAGFLGGPRVAVFNGTTLLGGSPARLIGDFFAFPGDDAVRLRNGAFVAAGDVNGDGFDDLLFGGGPGGAPRVFILSGALVSADVAGAQANPIANFFVANNSTDRGGVRVAVTDADDDERADVAAGSGEGSASLVRVYRGVNFTSANEPTTSQDITPFGGAVLPGGVFVG